MMRIGRGIMPSVGTTTYCLDFLYSRLHGPQSLGSCCYERESHIYLSGCKHDQLCPVQRTMYVLGWNDPSTSERVINQYSDGAANFLQTRKSLVPAVTLMTLSNRCKQAKTNYLNHRVQSPTTSNQTLRAALSSNAALLSDEQGLIIMYIPDRTGLYN